MSPPEADKRAKTRQQQHDFLHVLAGRGKQALHRNQSFPRKPLINADFKQPWPTQIIFEKSAMKGSPKIVSEAVREALSSDFPLYSKPFSGQRAHYPVGAADNDPGTAPPGPVMGTGLQPAAAPSGVETANTCRVSSGCRA
jgi:hypothetical protein